MRTAVCGVTARLLASAAAFVAAFAAASAGAAASLSYSGSIGVATGTYVWFERTNSLFLYNGVAFSSGRWRVSANLPLVAQSTPLRYAGGSVVPGQGNPSGGGPNSGGDEDGGHEGHHGVPPAQPTADSPAHDSMLGLSDPVIRTEFRALQSGRSTAVTIGMQIKVPAASSGEHGFGTGEWDYGAGLSAATRVGGGTVFADASYWILGDTADLELENPVSYGLAYGRPLNRQLALLGSFIGYSTLVSGAVPPAQAGLLLSWWMRPERSLSAGISVGMTESAPDVSFSLGWRVGG